MQESRWNFSARSRFRWSDSHQISPQLDSATSAHIATPFSSNRDSITSLRHGSAEVVLQHCQYPGSTLEHLSEKPLVQCSQIEEPKDSLSVKSGTLQPGDGRPSFFQHVPFISLLALVVAFLQIFASYAVLKLSDGRAVADWKFKPSVYLAILSVVSNGTISFAIAEGAVVTFWLRFLRGTTLGQLHRDWACGSDVYHALFAGKRVSVLAVACVFASLVCIDGPLLQRASSTKLTVPNHPINLNISVVPEIPAYFSGTYNYKNAQTATEADFSDAMLPIAKEYSANAQITSGVQGCSTTICATTIRAPALVAHHCESKVTQRNFSEPYTSEERKYYNTAYWPPHSRTLFGAYVTSINGSAETLDFHTVVTGNEVAQTCAGPVNSTHCYLRSAIAEYDVLVANDTITLKDPANPKFISWANNTAITEETVSKFGLQAGKNPNVISTTLGGIVNSFLFEFDSTASAFPPFTSGRFNIGVPSKSWFMFQNTINYKEYANQNACSYAWKDPRPAAMAGMNQLMFRIGVYAANNYSDASLKHLLDPEVQTHYNVIGSLQSPREVFKSEFVWYFAAAALESLTIVLVGSTLFGFWRLGRRVSFSPLEIARAFDAPLLAGLPSNLSGNDIASRMDTQQVQYGDIYGETETDQMGRSVGKMIILRRN